MKIPVFLIRMLLIIPICCLPTLAQDYTQFGLPEGAKARLGKGAIGEVQFSPDGSRDRTVLLWELPPILGEE